MKNKKCFREKCKYEFLKSFLYAEHPVSGKSIGIFWSKCYMETFQGPNQRDPDQIRKTINLQIRILQPVRLVVGRPGGSAESAVFSILQYIRQSPSLVGLPMCYLPTVLHNRNLSRVGTLHTLFELILTNIKDFGLGHRQSPFSYWMQLCF